MLSAHREALHLYRRGQRNLPADATPEERATVLAALGDEAAAADENAAAAEALTAAHDLLLGSGDRLAAVAIMPRLVAVTHQLGEHLDRRTARLKESLATLDGVPGAESVRAALLSGLAAAYMLDRRLDEATAYGKQSRVVRPRPRSVRGRVRRGLPVPFPANRSPCASRPGRAGRGPALARDGRGGSGTPWHPGHPACRRPRSGLVQLSAGDLDTARLSLLAARAAWNRLHPFWAESWATVDAARAALAARRLTAGMKLAADVRAAADVAGAATVVAAVDDLLRPYVRGRPTQPWQPLTEREYAVATLLSEGLTNREIAARLFVSPKTVSSHVGHILTKLGATRRAEIAAWAARIGA
jgi:DNA-binding CsgD family transcriptional regulator